LLPNSHQKNPVIYAEYDTAS